MSNKKSKVNIDKVFYDIERIINSNKLRGEEVTHKKLSNIRIAPGKTLGDADATRIINKYKKFITFG